MDYIEYSVDRIGLKARTKAELYKILTVEARLYLPPQQETSIEFIRDILTGKKKVLDSSQVKVCTIPITKASTLMT